MKPGIYEDVLNSTIAAQLQDVKDGMAWLEDLDPEEAASVLSAYAAKKIKEKLDQVGRLNEQIDLVNGLLKGVQADLVDPSARQLLGIMDEQDPLSKNRKATDLPRPVTSMAHSSLFTGSSLEPSVVSEFKKEILSCQKIDMLVSFIRWSGLRRILDELREFTEKGGQLRVVTTSYMGATEVKAIEELARLSNTEIRISYDTKRTRLHAKAYIFSRSNGVDTAYVGSSNLSNAAISSGLEWNVKITRQDLPETMDKIQAAFESSWNSPEFEPYLNNPEKLAAALQAEKVGSQNADTETFFLDVHPYPYQEKILDALKAQREIHHCFRNLVVAATGTGKTIIAALDYQRFRQENPHHSRLLLVAHRREILQQSLAAFRHVLKDANFGDLHTGREMPQQTDHVFVSIQTLSRSSLHDAPQTDSDPSINVEVSPDTRVSTGIRSGTGADDGAEPDPGFYGKLPRDYYDFIIVDEFHHAAADSYKKLFSYFQPKILLGLTATPERMDGKNVLDVFDGQIASSIRLPEAIDQRLLVPFDYFGVTDNVSLQNVAWKNGGYDTAALSRLYSTDNTRAALILENVLRYAPALSEVCGLGFCVSVEHAEFMADFFSEHHIPSLALSAKSDQQTREQARLDLEAGRLKFIFTVDLYNEGVDIPAVNMVLFLRPTESLTVFLQQLGRGLRHHEGKDCLTVLDFIGQAHKKYNFERKFQALLSHSTTSVASQIQQGFTAVPKGCYIHLERIARRYVLDNIRQSVQTRRTLPGLFKTYTGDTGKPLTLQGFLDYNNMSLAQLYKIDSFSRLQVLAGLKEDFSEPLEAPLNIGFLKLIRLDSPRWIRFLQGLLGKIRKVQQKKQTKAEPAVLASKDIRKNETSLALNQPEKNTPGLKAEDLVSSSEEFIWLDMFLWTIFPQGTEYKEKTPMSRDKLISRLLESPTLVEEMSEILDIVFDQIELTPAQDPDSVLEIGCTYNREQLFIALGYDKPNNIREGVKWLPDIRTDVLLVTLNKAEKEYSPTTLYQDYSISESLFHWQSQSTTSEQSPTGQRYIHHDQQGSRVLLFVRERKKEPGSSTPMAYTYLGPVHYVSHTSSRPMNITWKMEHPIPARYLETTSKLQ